MNWKIILSLLLGFIFGNFIIKLFYPSQIIHGPNSSEIKQMIYNDGDECYSFRPKAYICPLSILRKT